MIAAAEFTRPADMPLLDRLAQLGVPLADLTADSRAVKMGSIFVAYPGTVLDGRAYITDANTGAPTSPPKYFTPAGSSSITATMKRGLETGPKPTNDDTYLCSA